MSQPSRTKRVATVFWSLTIAGVLIVLTVGALLPSTKRAHFDFEEDDVIDGATTGNVPVTTAPAASPAVEERDRGHIFGSKTGVFEIPTPGAAAPSTQPTP